MTEFVSKEPIAVIGLGCVLPDAPDVASFWNNILAGKSSVREVSTSRWDPDLFWSADKDAPDKTYSKIGAFVTDDAFAATDYRMPPNMVQQIDPSQRWALAATRQAFKDAGLKTGLKGDEGRDFDRSRCAVILGNAMGGEQMKLQTKRLYWPQVERALRTDPGFQRLSIPEQQSALDRAERALKSDTPPITEDSMPGTLSNVAAGRIANVFDLSGKNFTTDAACASSIAALDAAIDTLRRGESDLVVWGGTDRSMDITPYIEFSKIGALSASGSRPFDADADGFVMGEGCVVFVLKRLSDAERDGDRIYAVVRGVGGSSDGKGKGITAPNPVGQVKAVLRAYRDAEVDPATVGYLEAHGTSTPVGDPVELQAADDAFKQLRPTPIPPGTIAVGSVKSNMGHLKSAAGAAGLLKVVLSLYRKELAPSINVKTLNPRIDWARSPFKVQTQRAPWPTPAHGVRRAAVSSFGFGGTNFHVVLDEYVKGALARRRDADGSAMELAHSARSSVAPAGSAPVVDERALAAYLKANANLEAEPLVLDASSAMAAVSELAAASGMRLRDALRPHTQKGIVAPVRVGMAVTNLEDIPKKLDQAQKAATNMAQARLAFQQGVFIQKGKPQGKVAFLFPGQGTQYVNMCRDLAQKYEVVRNTFEEADAVLMSELDGVKLTDILWPTPDTPEAREASEKKLQLTEFTQPAVLAADVAIFRLLRQWNVQPDVVAGHSLGEYGALVAAGVLSFADALHAVAARGREMAHVDVPDLGKMASVSADWHLVTEALKEVSEYVIPANKNCPSQTVIAGSSKGVDQAVALLQSKGLQAQYLPVSAAFHSAIVAPASKPLRSVLARLGVKAPKVRVLSNVGTEPYQDDPEWILDNLAVQVANPVEWIGIIERMYAEGVRVFIEVGPKLALTNFVRDILKEKPDAVAIGSNHPKKGGIAHVNELYAFLGTFGFQPALPELGDAAVYTTQFRDPGSLFRSATLSAAPGVGSAHDPARQALAQLADQLRVHLEGGVAASASTPKTVERIVEKIVHVPDRALEEKMKAFGISLDDIGVSGISIGLPGAHKELFAPDNFERILRGENLIDNLSEAEQHKMADKNIHRLVKGADGSAHFQAIEDIAEVIHLAGRRGGFDLTQWGVERELIDSLDRTFQYAIAAGLEALRDAGIPLVRTYMQTTTGGFLPKEWKLPEPIRDETGVIFASAFPGYDNLIRDVSRHLADKYAGRSLEEMNTLYADLLSVVKDDAEKSRLQASFEREFSRLKHALPGDGTTRYEFNRKFLFNVLSMGHSQLAQLIGARGPNTQINAACASSTQAIAIAEDWIRTGRARRILVVGADDVTSDAMFEWIGAGFLASGAATTKAKVEEAALPFDKRRHGMIVGMGAVGLVIEATPEIHKRGMRPIARVLATKVSNSAFHGSRLDVNHIADEMTDLLHTAEKRYGISPAALAPQTVFMSHETYTPARGGSASAEIHALRAAFGPSANKVVVANTKGFTGHPQGAGVEDAIVLKALQRGRLPPIANFRDPDPELGDLNLSHGGEYPNVRYALRLAAGFGSQVAMTLMELVSRENERVADAPTYAAWLSQASGLPSAQVEVKNRTLRIVDQGPPKATARVVAPAPKPMPAPMPLVVAAQAAPASAPTGDVLAKLIDLVAVKTGYPKDLLDPDLDMEADLGIDTVKQAELFGAIRDAYSLPQEQNIQIKDYPTLRKVAGYVESRLGGTSATAVVEVSPTPAATPAAAPHAISSQGMPLPASHSLEGGGQVLAKLTELVAVKTGYPKDLLDPDLDMEADLGIDTVKQAELFGAIRDAYSLPQEQNIQIKDYPTLRKVAGYVESRLGGAAPPSPPKPTAEHAENAQVVAPRSSPPVSAPSAKSALGPAAVGAGDALAKVTGLVAKKTGYPIEMLEPDLDMEADLGIDTVKQAELFGDVRAAFNIPVIDGLQIKDYPTLRKVAEFATKFSGATVGATPALAQAAAWSTGQDLGPMRPAADPTHPAKANVVTLPDEPIFSTTPTAPTATSSLAGIVRRVPTLRQEPLPRRANNLRPGQILAVGDQDPVLLGALKSAGFDAVRDPAVPVGLVCIATKRGTSALERCLGLFEAAKKHREALAKGFILIITAQEGGHGLTSVRDPAMAAIAGLGKALRKELPDAIVKCIDIAPDPSLPPSLILDELRLGGRRTEVCYDTAGRHVIDVVPEALPDAAPNVRGKVLVVSGGAQGITAELLCALAPQGPKLLLLGRTALSADAAGLAKLDAAGWKQKEADVMAEMKARGDKVTPVAIQKALSPMKKAAEVQRTLNRLASLGAECLYVPLDVANTAAVTTAVAQARQKWGHIHGVIHAAGLEISKDIASKDAAQFTDVFTVKAHGFDALMTATAKDKLEFLVGFGSVAGRFGNIGQVDYSAANEYLAKAIKLEAARRGVGTAFTVAWGPWGEVGMATRGSILQIMEATGVTPIPTKDGTAMFLRELATPGIRESVVGGKLGAIDVDGQVKDDAAAPRKPNGAVPEAIKRDPASFRLLDAVVAHTPGRSLEATVHVDQARDAYLRDHRVDGVPYLPGVFAVEAFAEAARLLVPFEQYLIEARDVVFASPLKQLKAAPVTARLTANATQAAHGTTVACKMTTQFVGPDGKPLGEPRLHFTATLVYGAAPSMPNARPPASTRALAREGIYPPFFHGPSFQVLAAAGPLDADAVCVYRAPMEQHFAAGDATFQSHPMLGEALFQACGLRTLVAERVMSLPAGIHHVFFGAGPAPDGCVLVAHPRGRDAQGNRLFDAEAIAPDGRVVLKMEGYAMVETGPAPTSTPAQPATESAKSAEPATPSASSVPSVDSVARPSAPPIPDAGVLLPEIEDVVFAAVAVEDNAIAEAHWFTNGEQAKHSTFPAPKRRDEWRAGRLAVKRAAMLANPLLGPHDIELRSEPDMDRPRLLVHGKEPALFVSLSHSNGHAIAALSPGQVGLDLEAIEPRADSFLHEAFTDAEIASIRKGSPAAATLLWAAKEAVLKRVGKGLRANLKGLSVKSDGAGGAVVEGMGGRFGVRFYDLAGKVLAVTVPRFDPIATATVGGKG